MARKITTEVICALLVMLFVYASISKIRTFETFKVQLEKSPYVSDIAGFVAWSLPLAELLVVVLLIIKKTRLIGLYAALFMMLLFTGYIYAILHFSYYVPCSCGGILSKMNWNDHLIFNYIFTFLALLGIILENKPKKILNPPLQIKT